MKFNIFLYLVICGFILIGVQFLLTFPMESDDVCRRVKVTVYNIHGVRLKIRTKRKLLYVGADVYETSNFRLNTN